VDLLQAGPDVPNPNSLQGLTRVATTQMVTLLKQLQANAGPLSNGNATLEQSLKNQVYGMQEVWIGPDGDYCVVDSLVKLVHKNKKIG